MQARKDLKGFFNRRSNSELTVHPIPVSGPSGFRYFKPLF